MNSVDSAEWVCGGCGITSQRHDLRHKIAISAVNGHRQRFAAGISKSQCSFNNQGYAGDLTVRNRGDCISTKPCWIRARIKNYCGRGIPTTRTDYVDTGDDTSANQDLKAGTCSIANDFRSWGRLITTPTKR